MRKAHGRRLARESHVAADLVMPFPDSGTYAALGYSEASAHTISAKYGDVEFRVIGRKELLKNKSATDRLKDKADVEEINRAGEN